MSESNMKSYYCHECGKNSVSEKTVSVALYSRSKLQLNYPQLNGKPEVSLIIPNLGQHDAIPWM